MKLGEYLDRKQPVRIWG